MKEIAKALQAFYSSFDWRAWPETSVPALDDDGTPLSPPYITYTLDAPHWDEFAIHQVRIWTRSESWLDVSQKADELLGAIGEGITLQAENGFVTLDPGSPLLQMQPMDDPLYKVAYINLQLGAFVKMKG